MTETQTTETQAVPTADASHTTDVVKVAGLKKTFRLGFFRKKVEAVRGIDFRVAPGEIFGLLGPNGAGKTTTIKMLLRLIFPDEGLLELFGAPPERETMRKVGYMPENPYVYQYLNPLEFLDLAGRLSGIDGSERRDRANAMVEKVGLGHAKDRPIGKFSKGMMQRVGLAQALLHDPEFLILDEPMSGLDPIGRKEIRDLLMEQRRLGKTLLFTSHILSDVEMLCDRVTILQQGKVRAEGTLNDLLEGDVHEVEIELDKASPALVQRLQGIAKESHEAHARFFVNADESDVDTILKAALEDGARIVAVKPQRRTLESLFVQEAV